MSLKLHNGFRFDLDGIAAVLAAIETWRAEIKIREKHRTARFCATQVTRCLDDAAMAGRAPDGDPPSTLMAAYSNLIDRQEKIRRTQSRDPIVDFEFQMQIFLLEDRWYGLAFCEQQDWLRDWRAQPFISDFSYWDNTDRPDGLPEAEWDRRAAAWEAILRPAGWVPAQTGLAATCHDSRSGPPDLETALQEAPGFEKRVEEAVRQALIRERLQAASAEIQASSSFSAASRVIFAAQEDFRIARDAGFSEGRSADLIALARDRLHPEITRDILLGKA